MINLTELIQRAAYGCRSDRRYRYYDQLRQNLLLSRTEMLDLQGTLIRRLIEHAYNRTEYYRTIMADLGLGPADITAKEDLLRLPVLTKSDIRKNIDRIKSDDNFSRELTAVTSGGSTGDQAIVYKSPYFNQMSRASMMRNSLLAGWMPFDKTVWIWGAPYEHEQLKGSLIGRLGFVVNRRLLLNAYRYSKEDFPLWVDEIQKYRPRVLYGYASIILEFARFLIEKDIRLATIQVVVSTTETLTNREVIEQAFGCNVYDQYGCREIVSIGIESEKGVMRIADDVVVLNTSEGGEFLVTALHSLGFPLINYKVGDCGEIAEADGHEDDPIPFTRARLNIGRITDNFLTSDNHTVSSSAVGAYLSTFRLSVLEQQIVQGDYRRFIVNFVPDNGFSRAVYEQAVRTVLSEYFGQGIQIQFNLVERINVEPSGKKLMFKRMFNY